MFKLFQVYFYLLLILFSLRYTIKGIHNLIFYGLPTYPHFYSEVCNMLQAGVREGGGSVSFTCTALYSRYDMHRLAAVTGADRAAQMLQSKKTVHLFITGEEKNTWRGTLKIDWHFQPQTKNLFPSHSSNLTECNIVLMSLCTFLNIKSFAVFTAQIFGSKVFFVLLSKGFYNKSNSDQ